MPTLREIFSDIADAIRTKTGKSEGIYPVDMASEIERIESGGGYKLEKMPSGAISSFNDGTDLPLNKLKVSIKPVQDLHGYDAPWVGGSHANKWDEQWEDGTYNPSTGSKATDVSRIRSKNPIKVSASTTYYFVKPSGKLVYLYYYDTNNDFISYADPFQTSGTGGTFTTPSNAEYLCFSILQTSYSSGIAVNYPSSVTTYAPYSNICPISGWDECNVNVSTTTSAEDGTTYTIQFKDGDNPLTVYGGTLDVTSGELTVTDAYIVSYNGETLPSMWISDRDVYAEGTAPTTGAEVVYKLANSVTYHLTPVQIRTLIGNNNIWADTGDIINGEYFKGAESSGSGIIYYIKNIRIECEVI